MIMTLARHTLGFAIVAALYLFSPSASAKPYKGGELYSVESYQYGKIEMRMRMARGSGLLSTFFLYKNGSEVAGTFWEEVDVEVLGKGDAKVWQSNIITGNPRQTSEQNHPHPTSLADAFHTFSVEWRPGSVTWYLDDVLVRQTEGGQAEDLMNPASLRFNIWSAEAAGWVGPFDDSVLPQYQFIDWVRFYRYEADDFVLDWEDDFETFDASRWLKANWTFEGNRVDFDPANVVVVDGTLVLALTLEGETGFTGSIPADGEPIGGPTATATSGGASSSGGGGSCSMAGAGASAWHGLMATPLFLTVFFRRVRRQQRGAVV